MPLPIELLYSVAWKILAAYVLLKGISSVIHRKLVQSLSIVDDLPKLGTQREKGQRIAGTAVVCGGRCVSGLYGSHFVSRMNVMAY